jgi:uncharacterized protein (TIGR03435 family)
MSSPVLAAVVNHLWQSTLFAVLAAALTLLMRGKSARVRYLLWLSASMKLLVPFAWLAAIGALIPWPTSTRTVVSGAGQMVATLMQPGGQDASEITTAAHATSAGTVLLIVLAVLWALGTAAVFAGRYCGWRQLRRALQGSTAASVPFVIPVRVCSSQLEPAVVGVFRPLLLLPEGLEQRLSPAELSAVLSHERCHVMWRDNLAAALHMLVEALFWFHPLIWWLGARLVAERERACDEAVLAEGHAPVEYAESILKICEHFLRVPCAAGLGGASLKHRIEDIMKNRLIEKLGGLQKACIILVAGGAVTVPVAIGLLTAPRAQAQAASPDTAGPTFSDVSIQLAAANDKGQLRFMFMPGGRVEIQNSTLLPLITSAYDVQESMVFGRQWGNEPRYNITMTGAFGPGPAASAAVRDLLTRRFGLVVKHQLRQVTGYVLMVGSTGSKLKAGQVAPGTPRFIRMINAGGLPAYGPASVSGFDANNAPLNVLVNSFSLALRAPVADETGLQGDYVYSYRVNWQPGASPDPAVLDGSLQEQLGLHLEARPLNVDTIDVVSLKPAQEVVTASR